MAGPFDDLIPGNENRQKGGGATNDPFADLIPKPKKGLIQSGIDSVQRKAGQIAAGTGRSLEDLGIDTGLKQWGNDVAQANAAEVNSIGDIGGSPGTFLAETVGETGVDIGTAVAGSAAGERIGRAAQPLLARAPGPLKLLAPFAPVAGGVIGSVLPNFAQTYGGIRQQQDEAGESDITRALGAAAASAALERATGIEGAAIRATKGLGGEIGETLLGRAAQGAVRGGLTEGATELLQNPIEQYGGFQDPLAADSLAETAFAGVKGAAGGGIVGGTIGAIAPQAVNPLGTPGGGADTLGDGFTDAEQEAFEQARAGDAAAGPDLARLPAPTPQQPFPEPAGPISRAVNAGAAAGAPLGAAPAEQQAAGQPQGAGLADAVSQFTGQTIKATPQEQPSIAGLLPRPEQVEGELERDPDRKALPAPPQRALPYQPGVDPAGGPISVDASGIARTPTQAGQSSVPSARAGTPEAQQWATEEMARQGISPQQGAQPEQPKPTLAKSGEPFKTEIAAKAAIRLNKGYEGMEVTKVPGGFGLVRPLPPAQPEPQGRQSFADPDKVERANLEQTFIRKGVAPAMAREMAQDPDIRGAQVDDVTGAFDGRVGGMKTSTVKRAVEHAVKTGEPSVFVSTDIFNLGGLNEFHGNKASKANKDFRGLTDIALSELRKTGGDVIPMRTGGDELGYVVVNASVEEVNAALDRAHEAARAYAERSGFANVPSKKEGRQHELGVGFHFGVAPISDKLSVEEILDLADNGVNLSKNKGNANVEGSPAQAPEAGASGERPGGAGEGVAGAAERTAAEGGPAAGADGRGAGDRGQRPGSGSEARGEVPSAERLDAQPGKLEPLPGSPRVRGFTGPDPRLVAVAEQYARDNGIELRRQAEYVKADPERGARIAAAYEAMQHAPQDSAVRAAYDDLIRQTTEQYRALEAAGYRFWFIDIASDAGQEYSSTPWNAMRDIRANQQMGVFPTTEGFGSEGINVDDNPLLGDTGIQWPFGGPDGPMKPVLANDLFRAVHDAFGHGLEGSGFRADGEENAWQAHVRLFTGPAVGAITSETRGQNSWLNFGPYGETNRNAKVEDTTFAQQKTGLMPEWTWQEGRAPDMPQETKNDQQVQFSKRKRPDEAGAGRAARGARPTVRKGKGKSFSDRPVQPDAVSILGRHYSNTSGLSALDGRYYGTGYKGAEWNRLQKAKPEQKAIKSRIYFYVEGTPLAARGEMGVGRADVINVQLDNLYDANRDPRNLVDRLSKIKSRDAFDNAFEQLIIDEGFDGMVVDTPGREMVVLLGTKPVPLEGDGSVRLSRTGAGAPAGGRMRADALRKTLGRITKDWGIEVKVVDSTRYLPEHIRNAPGFQEDGVDGVIDGQSIYIVANMIDSPADALRVLAHEGVGHFGMEGMLGDKFTDVMNDVLAMRDRGEMAEIFEEVYSRYSDGEGGYNADDATIAKEAIAIMAEKGVKNGVMSRVMGALRSFLRSLGIKLDFNEGDLRRMIADASQYVRTGGRRDADGVQFSKQDIKKIVGRNASLLTEAELDKLRRDTAQKFVDTLKKLPSAKEMANVALAGKAKRGWYADSAAAILQVFGYDAPRFAGLLAATSPQTGVEANLYNALSIWKNWVEAGRPTGRQEIVAIMGRSVQGNKGEDSVLPSWINNTVRALTSENPESVVLSGPKVNSFMLNLRGIVNEVTNDAWMANYALVDQTIFGGSLTKGGDPGKGPGYLAMSARTRQAAEALTKMTGEPWTAAEVQETVWSWAKTTYELAASADESRSAVELVRAGAITDQLIAATPAFGDLFHEAQYATILKSAGYSLDGVGGRRNAAPRQEEAGARGEAAPAAGVPDPEEVARAAKRLDKLRKQRAAASQVSFSRAPAPNTPEFKKWFKGSKVVDKSGMPLVVYHGTGANNIEEFDNAKGAKNSDKNLRGVFWFSDAPEVASGFAGSQIGETYLRGTREEFTTGNSTVYPVYLSMKNPYIDKRGDFAKRGGLTLEAARKLEEEGYDGIIWPESNYDLPDTTDQGPVKGYYRNRFGQAWGEEVDYPAQYAVFRSSQIKSIFNDKPTEDPRILFSRKPFYSAMVRSVEAGTMAKKGSAAAYKQWLDGAVRRGEFKQNERDWMGVDEWLDSQKGQITKQDLVAFVKANEVQIDEVVLGAEVLPPIPRGWRVARVDWAEYSLLNDQGNVVGVGETEREAIEDGMDPDEVADAPESIGAAKYQNYKTQGGKNYRELLLTLPPKQEIEVKKRTQYQRWLGDEMVSVGDERSAARWRERDPNADIRTVEVVDQQTRIAESESGQYRSNHWDQTNVLAHMRFNERVDADGNRVLFIQEIQSDWHQDGRKQGYQTTALTKGESLRRQKDIFDRFDAGTITREQRNEELSRLSDDRQGLRGVPDAPLKSTDEWAMLAFKRAARWAVENGFDRIAWATGEMNAEVFGIQKDVELIHWHMKAGDNEHRFVSILLKNNDEYDLRVDSKGRVVNGFERGNNIDNPQNFSGNPLSAVIGEEVAAKIMAEEVGILSGDGLKAGGSGMKGFYDDILPKAVNKWAKKFGAKVGQTKVDLLPSGSKSAVEIRQRLNRPDYATAKAHSLDITPDMREAVLQGQPLFSRRQRPQEASERLSEIGTMFRRTPAADEILVPGGASWLGAKVADARPVWLKAMTRQQIVEVGKDQFKTESGNLAEEFEKVARRLDADATANVTDPIADGRRSVKKIAEDWASLSSVFAGEKKRQAAGQMAALMHDATLAGIDPAKEMAEGADAAQYRDLRRRWDALPKEFKDVYIDARDAYSKRRKDFYEALKERISEAQVDGKKKREMLDSLRQHFEAGRVKGVYFPLSRFGEYWVRAKKGDEVVEFVMTEREQDQRAEAQRLRAAGYTVTTGKSIRGLKSAMGPSAGFMGDIAKMIDAQKEAGELPAGVADAITDGIWQMYLQTLPEQSVRKHFIHRKGTAGFSQDALRAFATQMGHGAKQLARVRHAYKMADLLQQMTRHATEQSPDGNKAADIVKGLDSSYEWMMAPKDSGIAQWMTSLGFMWYLGVSPAAALINTTQMAMVTLPTLAAKHGWARSGAALTKATKDYANSFFNKNAKAKLYAEFNGDMGRALEDMEKSGAIDRTMTASLMEISDTSTINVGAQKVMSAIGFLYHHAERLNRESTGIAAYRLARQRGYSHETAVEYGYEAIFGSHFDYSNANRAAFMRSNMAKVLLQFRQYSQNITYFMWRNLHQALKGESKEVRREAATKFFGTLGMTSLFAGAVGLPGYSMAMASLSAAHALFGDDDEPYDPEVEFRKWLAEHFGSAAPFLAKGAFNPTTGLDIAGRTGMGELWVRSPDVELEGKDLAFHYLEQAAGPSIGIFMNIPKAMKMLEDGQTERAAEQMVPKFVRDVLKAGRYAEEGALNMRGDPIVDQFSAWEIAGQSQGFSPAELSEQYAKNNAVKRAEQRILDRRQGLMNHWWMARQNGDQQGIAEAMQAIAKFNRRWPAKAITGDTLRSSMQSRQRYSRNAANGVGLDPKLRRELLDMTEY